MIAIENRIRINQTLIEKGDYPVCLLFCCPNVESLSYPRVLPISLHKESGTTGLCVVEPESLDSVLAPETPLQIPMNRFPCRSQSC